MGVVRELRRKINTPGWRLVSGVAVSLSLVGCAQVAPLTSLNPFAKSSQPAATQAQPQTQAQAQPQVQATATTQAAATAVASPTANLPFGLRTVAVRRGSISDVLLLNGRVAGLDELPLSTAASGPVDKVYVEAGDSVTRGQPLVDLDSKLAQKDLADAQSKVQTATNALARGQSLASQAQQQSNARRDTAVSDAQTRLRQTQATLDQVRAGASDSDKQAADAAVLLAQNGVDKAQADVVKASAPPDASALRTAQQTVAGDQVALQAAQADLTKLTAGPDAASKLEAQRALADAKAAQIAAQSDLDKLTNGADPYELRAAQRAVDSAQAALDAASAKDPKDPRTGAQKDAAATQAKLGLQDAQDKLAKLKQPPDPAAVQLAQSKLDDAKAQIAAAQDKLNMLLQPPDPVALAKAQSAVDAAQANLDNAKASLAQLQAGSGSDQIRALNNVLDAARAGLTSAQIKRDDVYNRPTPAELQSAQDAVNSAQQALNQAQNGTLGADSASGPDVQALQEAVQDANKQLQTAQAAVDATHLRAPADSVVAQVLVRSGDTADATKPTVILAQSNQPIVRVNLLDGDKPKTVQIGNKVQVQLDGNDGSFDGEVADFGQPAANGDRIALINVDWKTAQASVGTGARASITVQQRDQALILPLRAIKASGANRFVETMNGSTRKTIPVQVGIISGTEAEILNGVDYGQTVILDSSTDGSSAASASPTPAAIDRTGATATPAPSSTSQPVVPPPSVASEAGSSGGSAAQSSMSVRTLLTTGSQAGAVAAGGAVLDEWFFNNTRNWPSNPQGTAWVSNGAYNIATRNPGQFVTIEVPGVGDLTDVTMTGSFRKTAGPNGGGYGFVLRAQQSAGALDGTTQTGRYYVFEASDQGEFGIWLRDNDQWVDLVPWTRAPSVRSGTDTNELTVSAQGDQFTFSINGAPLATETDSQLSAGRVGVFVGGDKNQVALEHLNLIPLSPTVQTV